MKKFFKKVLVWILMTLLVTGTSSTVILKDSLNAYAEETIIVNWDEFRFLQQDVERFRDGLLPGEYLCSNIISFLDNEEYISAIQESCEKYSASKAAFTDLVLEYADLFENFSEQLVSGLGIKYEEIDAYEQELRALVAELDQGKPEIVIMTRVRDGYAWLEVYEHFEEVTEKLESAYSVYTSDKNELIKVASDVLQYLKTQLEGQGDPTLPVDPPVYDGQVLSDPRVTETLDPDTGESSYRTVWDCVWLGSYPQSDRDGLIKEPVKWRVLDVDGSDAFLLSDVNLDNQRYDTSPLYQSGSFVDYTYWEAASLRDWLNSTFYETAFSENEREAIRTVTVVTPDNPFQRSSGGKATEDKIYLLSIQEASNAEYGFPDEFKSASAARTAVNTAYAHKRGAASSGTADYQTAGSWLLRSPGRYPEYPYEVPGAASGYCASVYNSLGSGNDTGESLYTSNGVCVRPCMHIDLTSDAWSYAGIVCSDGRTAQQEPGTGPEGPEITEKTASGILRESDGITAIWTVNYYSGEDKQAKLTISLEGGSEEYSTSVPFIWIRHWGLEMITSSRCPGWMQSTAW